MAFFLAVAFVLVRVRQDRGTSSEDRQPVLRDVVEEFGAPVEDAPAPTQEEEEEDEATSLSAHDTEEGWEQLSEPVTEGDREQEGGRPYRQTGPEWTLEYVLSAMLPDPAV